MDVSYGQQAENFRAELRSWLDTSLPAPWRAAGFWADQPVDEAFARRRQWEADKAAAGFAGIQWPTEYGGRGGTAAMKAVYDEEMARAHAPTTVNALGLTFLAPTVMAIGTPEQQAEIIGPLLRNDVIWCQGFSEPNAGSDLAAVQTRAVVDGADYVVNGQKIWTSNALQADRMFALVRTSSEGRKHEGITMLLIDLHAPGVDIRPLKQMSGALDFGEVFLTDVRVPRTAVLGAENGGWKVAMLLLSFERGGSALGQYEAFRGEIDAIVGLAHGTERDGQPAAQDALLRQKIAAEVIELELLRLHSYHVLTQVEQGRELGAASSMTKLQWSETHQDIGELFTDVTGEGHQVVGGDAAAADLQASFLWSRSETIWGGSSEIQRGIVAERLLGLPR